MLSARQIMRQPVITIPAAESVAQAVREMQAHDISCLLVPPRSGPVAIASFCVEQGRWSPRGREDAARFASAAAAVPSREAKIAMKAPASPAHAGGAEVSQRQQEVWKDVAKVQKKIGDNLGTMVASPQSRSRSSSPSSARPSS